MPSADQRQDSRRRIVVVDGSNLATEGRTTPSLRQLDEAVRAYAEEDPQAEIVVVVDASFEHRVDPAERGQLVDAELHGEVVSPPAGAIGRGDAFVLRIAERTGARVLSNDSFQEFHAEHPWLFEEGRLVGGKPVPGVGWIFTPRVPVRGPKSRRATAKAKVTTQELSPPVKAAELAKAARKLEAKKTLLPDGTAPKVGDTWPLPATSSGGVPPAAANGEGTAAKSVAKSVAKMATEKKTAAKKPADKKPADKKSSEKKAEGTKQPGEKKAATASADKERGGEKAAAEAVKKPAEKKPADKKPADKKAAAVKKPAKAQGKAQGKDLRDAIDQATAEALSPASEGPGGGSPGAEDAKKSDGKRRRRKAAPPPAVNEPLDFITFVASYPMESEVEGEVVSFTSHGAMVDVALPSGGTLHCYIPVSAMGDPPPAKAREILSRGEHRRFVLAGLDPPRRVAELALPVGARSAP